MPISSAQILSRPAVVGLGAVSALLATGALFLSTSEAMLRAQFVTAFDSYTVTAPGVAQKTAGNGAAPVPFAAGEDFWLGGAHRSQVIANTIRPASWGGPVAVGDEITLSGANGQRAYQIIAITELPTEGVTHIAHGAVSNGLLLVTAVRKDSNPDQHIRFVIDRNGSAGQNATAPSAL